MSSEQNPEHFGKLSAGCASQGTIISGQNPDYPLKITALKFLFSPYFCDSIF